ncbi:aminotransferase [Streptosporangium amethystogenes]|uniref:aminotransferase n=1 Tax=Streptosporangium amethystogenes TaxID=2002 RepID=UPI0004C6F52C|nr:aminotransferase [Streptosporangium amethystogenes]
MRLNPRTRQQIDSPFDAAYLLLDQRCKERDLLDLAQGAPPYPTAPAVVEHVASVARQADGGAYVEIAGLPRLRQRFAEELTQAYGGRIGEENVIVTAGCNQAFCLIAAALAEAGDEIILALPFYPNHDMWLRLTGIQPVYLQSGPDLVPTVERAETLVGSRTRAIVLITPGNPSGVTLAPEVIAEFAEFAARKGIALILDETYRSFRDTEEPAHKLFADPGWGETVVSLHSFSKDFALPGYRVGALVASPEVNREVLKLLDCVAICAPRIGQEAAWAGLTGAAQWRRERAGELAARRRGFAEAMAARPGGFELVSVGGFFGWVRHPFAGRPTEEVVRDLAIRLDTLVIPGTAFVPGDQGMIRVSVGNLTGDVFADLAERFEMVRKL